MVIPRQDVRRLRRLLQRRIVTFEQRLQQDDAGQGVPPPGDLEREARALMALLKALQATADMEAASTPRRRSHADPDAAIRRRLAQQLEALCAQTRPPHRRRGAE